MKKETLFLDFDGPLFPDRWIRFAADNRKPYPGFVDMPDMVDYWKMDPMSVELLNFLYDLHPFNLVISSSWKKFVNREQAQDLLVTNGLNLVINKDDWCTMRMDDMVRSPYGRSSGCVRAAEIKEYIDRHNIEEYLILDDPWSGSSLDEKDNGLDPNRVILVDPDVGIGSPDYKRMLHYVKKWANIPDSPVNYLW